MARRLFIPVDYEFVAGRHFFTAATTLGQGLCVAHGELKTAFDEAGRQLKIILYENHALKLSNDVAEPGALKQLRHLLSAEPGSEGKRIQIDWACWILEQPTA